MGNGRPRDSSFEALRRHFEAHQQGHVFRFWGLLDAAGRERLRAQAAGIDLPALLRSYRARTEDAAEDPRKLDPVRAECLPEYGGDAAAARRAERRGEEILAAGRVAAMVVAGGQATRLGFDGPKGAYPLGPVTGRSLFEQQAQKIHGLQRRCGCAVPWYVMTSPATDAATREFFERANRFGLGSEDVVFFQQAMVPSFDFEGRLILAGPDRIFENPNGHGGSLTALISSGVLDDMESRGIDTIFYYQVDNPLVRIGDPVYLGFHDAAAAEASCKVVRKQDPHEKVGVVAQSKGRLKVVEYTELDRVHRFARDEHGDLVYWAGSTAIHLFATSFVRRVAADADRVLPYHAAAKKIPTVDDAGQPVNPSEPNGYKLERFVFDALPEARSVCVVEARRADEYSPVKNADGADSPATARRDLVAQYRSWLEAGGVDLPPPGTAIEIDHSRVDGAAEARALAIRHTDEAPEIIRVASGASP